MSSTPIYIAVLVLVLTATALCTPYQDCGSKGATITNLTVGDCKKLPCELKKGTNVSFAMDFKANMDITNSTTNVYVYFLGERITYHLPDPNSCDFMTCPVKSGSADHYKQSFPIKSFYPEHLTIVIEWQLVSGKEVLTCFKLSVQIKG